MRGDAGGQRLSCASCVGTEAEAAPEPAREIVVADRPRRWVRQLRSLSRLVRLRSDRCDPGVVIVPRPGHFLSVASCGPPRDRRDLSRPLFLAVLHHSQVRTPRRRRPVITAAAPLLGAEPDTFLRDLSSERARDGRRMDVPSAVPAQPASAEHDRSHCTSRMSVRIGLPLHRKLRKNSKRW
jgi:hypothetical protein